ncbi:hypothetical protein BDY17DRAFT_313486 [Neohortaea acidophila]|uniref:J domain-containing protein n=1 Tax=Neohortaea acidophila TaxID=245834 RepID=A0A6A6PJ50_9PEZI|nr:uncharacterized protein BDY17DRAFT_313486 [Neohortaea acidophila]KAF2479741.1 hypothetical protein BDY17DRAFT_313486 [Neohortaea acidophila]
MALSTITADYYAVLGVTQTATTNEIIRAYKFRAAEAQVKKAHGQPAIDHHSLWKAYDTLRDEDRRQAYDPTYSPPNSAAPITEQAPTWENNMFARPPEELQDPFLEFGDPLPPGYRPLGLPGDSNDPIYRLNNRIVDLGTAHTNRIGAPGRPASSSESAPTVNEGGSEESEGIEAEDDGEDEA